MNQRHLLLFIIVFILALPFILIKLRVLKYSQPWLFKKQIIDERFGRLWYVKDRKNPANNHYQGYIHFEPEKREISILFNSKDEFDYKQKIFFEEIEKNYQILYPKNLKLLENHYKTKLDDLFLDSIFISKNSNLNQLWSLTYCSIKNNLLNITINYQGWDIQNIK